METKRWIFNGKHGLTPSPSPHTLWNQQHSPPLQHTPVDGSDPACGEWGEQGHHVVLSCVTHTPHAHTHIYVHTDPITHHHHLRNCPTWPFILSWAVAERPYTSADFWLTGREDTPTWSPFSSSTTPPSPQKPPPALLSMSQEKTHLSQSVSEQDVSWGEKVSSRVTVHCWDGGCFFTRVWEGAVSLWWEDGGKNQEEEEGVVRNGNKACGCLKKRTMA